jgi:DNA gyrase/topoisomerase IV subunit A
LEEIKLTTEQTALQNEHGELAKVLKSKARMTTLIKKELLAAARVFAIDITRCRYCEGRLRVIGDVIDPEVIRTILDHINKARPPPRASPIRIE